LERIGEEEEEEVVAKIRVKIRISKMKRRQLFTERDESENR